MSHHHGTLICACDQKGCKATETFTNENGQADIALYVKATKNFGRDGIGWFLPDGAKDMCPQHHGAKVSELGWHSLYEEPQPRRIPIDRGEADKTQKAKKGAD